MLPPPFPCHHHNNLPAVGFLIFKALLCTGPLCPGPVPTHSKADGVDWGLFICQRVVLSQASHSSGSPLPKAIPHPSLFQMVLNNPQQPPPSGTRGRQHLSYSPASLRSARAAGTSPCNKYRLCTVNIFTCWFLQARMTSKAEQGPDW